MLSLTLIQLVLTVLLFKCGLSNKNKFKKTLYIILSILLWGIVLIQFVSLRVIGKFIPPIAFENIDQGAELGNSVIQPFLIAVFVSLGAFYLSKKFLNKINIQYWVIFLIIVTYLPSISPIHAFKKSYLKLVTYPTLSENDAKKIDHQLTKKYVFTNSSVDNYLPYAKNTNMIVIFAEGFSSLIISQKLTPNIYNFRQNSINIENYYNHTAATFRGLRGQLTSSYQKLGGYYSNNSGVGQMSKKEIDEQYNQFQHVTPVTAALSQHGYTNYFQASNSVSGQLSLMLSTLKFDKIYGLEDHTKQKDFTLNELSDQDSYDLLFDKVMHAKQPFFYGAYTVGTHLGLDSPDIKFGDGKNPYLNKFHSLDYWFGQFLEKFNHSELSKNTILILTTDHASFPAKDYQETFHESNPFFVDKIPFIIYKKGITPQTIDVKGQNSLSLSPTILDLLRINEFENKFLGTSIFDNTKPQDFNYETTIGLDYFSTKNSEISVINDKKKINQLGLLQVFGDH